MNKIFKKILAIFYRKKTINNFIVKRVLFFRWETPCNTDRDFCKENGIALQQALRSLNIKEIGKYSYSANTPYVASKETIIGKFCSLGNNIRLGHGNHPLNFLTTSPYLYFDALGFKDKEQISHNEYWDLKPIYVGNDVWIGDSVFIKNGVKIGDGAVIGAQSIVTKDIPPYAIAVGNPARVIKYRFTPEIIDKLLKLKWWDLDEEIIKQIPYDEINKAIEFLENVKKDIK